MADIDYRVSTSLRPDADSEEERPNGVIERFKRFAADRRTDGPYHLLFMDGTTSVDRTAAATIDRLEVVLPRMDPGDRLRVVSENLERFKVIALEDSLTPVSDVPGTRFVRYWVATLRDRWPDARLAGTCVCKDDSTSKCNGHRDCAAADDFDTWPHMIDQYDYLRRDATGPDKHGVSYLILGAPGAPKPPRIWTYGRPRTISPRGERIYTGDPHYHLHASFADGRCGIACEPSSQWPR